MALHIYNTLKLYGQFFTFAFYKNPEVCIIISFKSGVTQVLRYLPSIYGFCVVQPSEKTFLWDRLLDLDLNRIFDNSHYFLPNLWFSTQLPFEMTIVKIFFF